MQTRIIGAEHTHPANPQVVCRIRRCNGDSTECGFSTLDQDRDYMVNGHYHYTDGSCDFEPRR